MIDRTSFPPLSPSKRATIVRSFQVVGRRFMNGMNGATYLCDSEDREGFWMTPEVEHPETERVNVSDRAIERTFYRIDDEDGFCGLGGARNAKEPLSPRVRG